MNAGLINAPPQAPATQGPPPPQVASPEQGMRPTGPATPRSGDEPFGGKYVGPMSPDKSTWTPDELESYDAYKAAATEALHGKTAKQAEKILESAFDPKEGVAMLGASVFVQADSTSAEMLGGEPPAPMVRFWAANEVVPQVFELAEAVGIRFNKEDTEAVTGVMLNKYFDILEKNGQLDMETGRSEFEEVTGMSLADLPQQDVQRAGRRLGGGTPPFQKTAVSNAMGV